MASGRIGNVVKAIGRWFWRGERLRQLRLQIPDEAARAAIRAAESCACVAWRALAGVEPIPAEMRGAVATPLLLVAAKHCGATVHAERFSQLFEREEWQQRFVAAGLSLPEQLQLKTWFDESAPDPSVAKRAMVSVSAALALVQAPAREIRWLLWRRVLLVAWLLGIFGGALVVAINSIGSGRPDLAAGKMWRASSAYPGFHQEGSKPGRPIEGLFFSTNEEEEPWWQLDLGTTMKIDEAEITNRSDCCPDRAHPIVHEISRDGKKWREMARQPAPFRTWQPKFGPTKTRFVRLRALKRTNLHLKDVRIFGTRD